VRLEMIVPKGAGNLTFLATYQHGSLYLCLPLTPTENTIRRLLRNPWGAAELARYNGVVSTLILAQARHALGSYERPWCQRATLDITRCSNAQVLADEDNVIAGCKGAIDALKPGKDGRVKAGLIPDDSPKYLKRGAVVELLRRDWGELKGPATWMRLTPIREEE